MASLCSWSNPAEPSRGPWKEHLSSPERTVFSVSVLVPGQGKYHIRGIWKRQMAQRNKDLSKPESTSPPTCPPARAQLPADTEPWAPEAQQPRSDSACRPVWSNFPTNRFLISLKAQSSGSLAMSEDRDMWSVGRSTCSVAVP